MNPRERLLAMIILGAVVLGGGAFLYHRLVLEPLQDRDDSIALLKEENEQKRERIQKVLADRPKLERWRQLSLPGDADLARREYEKYLRDLLRKSGAEAEKFGVISKPGDSRSSPVVPGKGPVYTRLAYTVSGPANLKSLVQLLEQFYRTGLLHQIKTISVQRPAVTGTQQPSGELDITLAIEALSLSDVKSRPSLLPGIDPRLLALEVVTNLRGGPGGVATVPWAIGTAGPLGPRILADPPRHYAAIAGKNIFTGRAPGPANEVDVTQLVHLTDITRSDNGSEACLHNGQTKTDIRLGLDGAYQTFRILDSRGELRVQGKVVRIEDREVIFRSGEHYYSIQLGKTLADALKTPLTADQVKALELTLKL
jgi:hypothetical protein